MTWDPYKALLAQPHITYVKCDLLFGQGRYYHAQRTIVLNRNLTQVERRCALTHELIHAERGDVPTGFTWTDARVERATDMESARRLIPLDLLVDAFRWTTETYELADELNVEPYYLAIRMRHLTDADRDYIRQHDDPDFWVC